MSLSDADRKSVVNYRVERAYATLKEAEDVATRGWYNLAANRLYYALYYAVSALLIHKGLIVKTHSGGCLKLRKFQVFSILKTNYLQNLAPKLEVLAGQKWDKTC